MTNSTQTNDDQFWAHVIMSAEGFGNVTDCVHCLNHIEFDDGCWRHDGDADCPYDDSGHALDVSRRARCVVSTVPATIRWLFPVADDEPVTNDDLAGATDRDDAWSILFEDFDAVWEADLTRSQWQEFRDWLEIDPNECDHTLGMIAIIDGQIGHAWALAIQEDGMSWNMGGISPLTSLQVYFCCLDPDLMERAGVTPPPEFAGLHPADTPDDYEEVQTP